MEPWNRAAFAGEHLGPSTEAERLLGKGHRMTER